RAGRRHRGMPDPRLVLRRGGRTASLTERKPGASALVLWRLHGGCGGRRGCRRLGTEFGATCGCGRRARRRAAAHRERWLLCRRRGIAVNTLVPPDESDEPDNATLSGAL